MNNSARNRVGTVHVISANPFEECLVEGNREVSSRARRARRKALAMSLTIELSLLVSLIAMPFFTSVARPQFRGLLPPGIVYLPPGPEVRPAQNVTATSGVHSLTIRDLIRQPAPFRPQERPASRSDSFGPNDSWDPGSQGVADLAQTPMGYVLNVRPSPPPPAERPAVAEKRPMKVSEGVLQAQLIARVEPRYPILAKLTKQEGTVVLHAIISREGRIIALEVVSGHPLLVPAALEAVREWRYRPTLLDGEPVEVETTIRVVFQMQH